MTWEILFVLGLTVYALVSFAREKTPADQTSLLLLGALIIAGQLPFAETLPKTEKLLSVFANSAPLTIAAMFVLSAALDRCGLIDSLATVLGRLRGMGYRTFLTVMMSTVALISAFINNTPVVIIFLPIILSLGRTLKIPASKLLIPLSFAAVLGGCMTLLGTSTNILASGLLESRGLKPISMFELLPVGLPLTLFGILFVVLFGDRLLPERETLTSMLSQEQRKEFLIEAFLQRHSPLVGIKADESALVKSSGLRLLEIIRNNVAVSGDPRKQELEAGDRLVLAARAAGVAQIRSIDGLDLFGQRDIGLETISAHEGQIVEGIIGPKSSIIGTSARELNFRQRFRVILIAVHRRGVNLRERVDDEPFLSGDLLLMMGTDAAINNLRVSDDVLLLDLPPTPSYSLRKKAPIVLATLAAIVTFSALETIPIAGAALAGVAVLLATRCIPLKEAYASIEWGILMLIFGTMALGIALESSGAAGLLADGMAFLVERDFVSLELRPILALLLVYVTACVVTELLSNNASVALLLPIALSLAETLGIDARPLAIATCIASSASFATPIGYQTNTYVYGVGGYRFIDFLRIGLPLTFLSIVVGTTAIALFWTF